MRLSFGRLTGTAPEESRTDIGVSTARQSIYGGANCLQQNVSLAGLSFLYIDLGRFRHMEQTTDKPLFQRRKMRQYFNSERAAYKELAQRYPVAAPMVARLQMWLKRTDHTCQTIVEAGYEIPDSFFQPYTIPKPDFLTDQQRGGEEAKRPTFQLLQLKYQLRAYNILREYLRCIMFYPEILDRSASYDILELSSGSCATAELAREFNNAYRGVDYLSHRGFVYEALHRDIGVHVDEFDGKKLPYDFDDQSCDLLLCFQAIDAYGPAQEYHHFIHEMTRIARRRVVVAFNVRIGQRSLEFDEVARPLLEQEFPTAKFGESKSPDLPVMVIDTGGF